MEIIILVILVIFVKLLQIHQIIVQLNDFTNNCDLLLKEIDIFIHFVVSDA